MHGAAGGIGTAVTQLAKALGARVIARRVSTDAKAAVARAAGADDVVLADGFLPVVKELTGGRGVDVVVDPVGGDRFTDSLRSLATEGRLLVIGFTGGEIPTVKREPPAAQQHRRGRRRVGRVRRPAAGLRGGAVGGAAAVPAGRRAHAAGVRHATDSRRPPRRWPRSTSGAPPARSCSPSADAPAAVPGPPLRRPRSCTAPVLLSVPDLAPRPCRRPRTTASGMSRAKWAAR